MVYMLQFGIKSPRATQRLVCNPGVVSKTLTCIYDCAAVNWFRIKLTNLRRHALRMNPGCTKPSTLGAANQRSSFSEAIFRLVET
jgi:hypothetical protein